MHSCEFRYRSSWIQFLQTALSPWLNKDVISICVSFDSCFDELQNTILPISDCFKGDMYYVNEDIVVQTYEEAWRISFRLNKEILLVKPTQTISPIQPRITKTPTQKKHTYRLDYWNTLWPWLTKDNCKLFKLRSLYLDLTDIWITDTHVFWTHSSQHVPGLWSWSYATGKISETLSQNDLCGFLQPIINILVLSEDGQFVILATYHHLILYDTQTKTCVDKICLLDKGSLLRLLRLNTTSFLILQDKTLRLYAVRLPTSETK